ncbi:MAG: site-2 protease family protein [Akkermansia sp.]
MDSILSVLATIAIIFGVVMLFNFMIFIHELGHFFAARWRGLYVDRFQIWFGRPIWKKTVNGVQWGLGWIPAGGLYPCRRWLLWRPLKDVRSFPRI